MTEAWSSFRKLRFNDSLTCPVHVPTVHACKRPLVTRYVGLPAEYKSPYKVWGSSPNLGE